MTFTKLMAPVMMGAFLLPITAQAVEYTQHTGVNEAVVPINGSITPTVVSFTVPMETTFTIDPNQEAGQQFIAPNFNISNDSNSPLTVGVLSFAQTAKAGTTESGGDSGDVRYANFTDVNPDEISNWGELGRSDSETYLALALNLLPTLGESETNEPWLVDPQTGTTLDTVAYQLKTSEANDGMVYAKEVQTSTAGVLLGVVAPHQNRYLTLSASHGLAFPEAIKSQYNVTFVFNLFDEAQDLIATV